MDELILLTDASVDIQSRVGYGAYLRISDNENSMESLKTRVKVKRFNDTSSTKLELQTLLWALGNVGGSAKKVTVYTDSQNIVSLPGRRKELEKNNYRSKRNRPLNNRELYQEFYRVTDQLNCIIVKVRGHRVSSQKDDMDRLFTLVDRGSRNALRREMKSKEFTL